MRFRRPVNLLPRRGAILVMPAAAVAVHQLRYWLAYGPRANAELAAQGHSYLNSLVPWTVFALAVAGGVFLRRAATALRTGDAGRSSPLPAVGVWLLAWVALLTVYAVQESLEGALAAGHPAGVAGVFGHGGWWAIPAAAVVAAVVAAVLFLGRALLRIAAGARASRRRPPADVRLPAGLAPAVVRPLARAAAGRAPPASLLVR